MTDNIGFRVLARLGVATMTLRYEDFLLAPEPTLRSIADFAGLETTAGDLGFLRGNTATLQTPMHSIAGNPLRFGGDEITLRVDDAWRTELPTGDRRTVTAICAPVLAWFGYPIRG